MGWGVLKICPAVKDASFMPVCVHIVRKHLCVPGTVLGTKDASLNETGKYPKYPVRFRMKGH